MSTLNDKLFNLGMMYGSGMRARQNEHDTIETLKAALNQGKDGTNSTISGMVARQTTTMLLLTALISLLPIPTALLRE